MTKRTRKTTLGILQIIKEFLDHRQHVPIIKSDLREFGIDPRTAERFFRLIHYCQNEILRISINELDNRFIILTE